jgi:hypothetical protein
MDILVGCDPELFVFDQAGRPVSGAGMIPGTKLQPYPVPKGAVQVDGTAWEFNTEPAKTKAEFVKNVAKVLGQLRKMLPDGYDLRNDAVVNYEEEYFRGLSQEEQDLGCDPDFNAYTMMENIMDEWPEQNNPWMRTASGHIHVGWTEDQDPFEAGHFQGCCRLVKELDAHLGLWSIPLEGPMGPQRRQLYGRAGAFRPKPYGLEYRVLSNFWVGDADLTGEVYSRTKKAVNNLVANRPDHVNVNWENMQMAINTGDVQMAKDLRMFMREAGVEF